MVLFLLVLLVLIIVITDKKGMPWFLYHHIGDEGVSALWFEEHLKTLESLKMKTLTNREMEESIKKLGKIEKNSVALTFDDGYYDNYKYAFPLLKKYKMKATIYLNTAYIENETEREFKYLSWREIEEMSKSGLWDVQLHSHKHMPIFVDRKLERVVNELDLKDRDIQHLYGEKAKEDYPIFGKRGEYSSKGIIVNEKAAEKFKSYYESLEGNEEDKIKAAQKYIDEILKDWFVYEDDTMAEKRIVNDLEKNMKAIEKHCGYTPSFFCWPWGHKNKDSIEILKKKGIFGFVTTRKGTNSLKIDLENIKRIELRKFTPFKFKLNVLIARNYFLGRVYQLLS